MKEKLMKSKISMLIAEEQGDVPGWVLITLMTAGLTVLIWGVAGPALKTMFGNAVNKVVAI
jgi:hypothetical protein